MFKSRKQVEVGGIMGKESKGKEAIDQYLQR
jgi:hypothetical protein